MNASISNLSVNNSRNSTSPYIRWQHANWIIPEVVNIILMLLTTWILYSLIHYGTVSKKWVTRKERNFEKLNAGLVLMAAVLCTVMALFRFITSQLTFNIGFSTNENKQCEMLSDASIIIFCLATFSVFVYLWVRQTVFYANRMLNTDFSKGLRFFSYLSILLIFLGGLGAIFVNTIPNNYKSSLKGCVYHNPGSSSSLVLVIVSSLVFLAGQIVLVGLLIYPLHRHSKQKGCLTLFGITGMISKTVKPFDADKESQDENRIHQSRTNQRINQILRRTVLFSIIIVVSNLVLLIVSTYAFTQTDSRRISTMLYDIITFVNLAFVVSSIGGWRSIVRLTPPSFSITYTRSTPRGSRVNALKCNSVLIHSNAVL